MWGFEPQQKDMVLADGADFIQEVNLQNPSTGDAYNTPAGSRVFFRVGNEEWEGTVSGSTAQFKVESEITDSIRRGVTVQFCMSVPDGAGYIDWVITQGKVVRV